MELNPERTLELWLLTFSLLVVSLLGWLRLKLVIDAWQFLQQAGVQPGPPYQALLGAVWGLGGLICAGGLLARRRWAPLVIRLTVLFLVGWYWLDTLVFTRAPDALTNWPYQLVLTLTWVGFTFGVLALDRQKRYFGVRYGSR